jgi:hypothetical protein
MKNFRPSLQTPFDRFFKPLAPHGLMSALFLILLQEAC